jgi:hypothetical protein
MRALLAFLGNAFREGTKESFGRVMSLPFLISSWGILTGGGIYELVVHKSTPIDSAATLAVIGIGLFTGSKYLHIKGSAVTASSGEESGAKQESEQDPKDAA